MVITELGQFIVDADVVLCCHPVVVVIRTKIIRYWGGSFGLAGRFGGLGFARTPHRFNFLVINFLVRSRLATHPFGRLATHPSVASRPTTPNMKGVLVGEIHVS